MSAMKRCKNCGKRIFYPEDRYGRNLWRHYGFGRTECDPPLRFKYAEPKEATDD